MDPTAEQSAILDAVRNGTANLLINALAGTGKTASLRLIQEVLPPPVLYLAFNKSVVKEIHDEEDPDKQFKSTTEIRTFNSLGHRIWSKACVKNLSLEKKKSQEILKEEILPLKRKAADEVWDSWSQIIEAVALAKALGYVPNGVFPNARRLIDEEAFFNRLDEHPTRLVRELVDRVLTRSIRSAYEGWIDYNDQIYMPALFGGTFPRFPNVLVDEGQDLNPVNHAMLDRLVRGRFGVVGDPQQSIYGFRGAVTSGMACLRNRFSCADFPLTISFRCPSEVVRYARQWVPEFKWSRVGGSVSHLSKLNATDIADMAVFICRNNAPLLSLALNLLSRGRSVSVAGSDIGPKLVGTLRRLGSEDLSRSAVLGLVSEWEAARVERGSTAASDLAGCMRVFAHHGETLGQAVAYAEHLFKQSGSIRLMTGHKAKGLEFDTVYHLDPWLIGEGEQEQNLHYVISTRAKEALYEIDSRDIIWEN